MPPVASGGCRALFGDCFHRLARALESRFAFLFTFLFGQIGLRSGRIIGSCPLNGRSRPRDFTWLSPRAAAATATPATFARLSFFTGARATFVGTLGTAIAT